MLSHAVAINSIMEIPALLLYDPQSWLNYIIINRVSRKKETPIQDFRKGNLLLLEQRMNIVYQA